jgi:Protein of unknown function (DUF2586)
MRHTIITTILNTPSGTPSSSDGVMMLVCKGVATTGGTHALVLDTAYLGNKLSDFVTGLNITKDYDVVNSCNVYQQISEFYAEAGDGAYLWLVVTATSTAYATYCAYSTGTTFLGLVRGTIQSDVTMQPKIIGLCYNQPTTQQSSTDFDSDALATIPVAQACAVGLSSEGLPLTFIIDGRNMSSTATSATIGTLATKVAPQVSFCITGSKPNGVASVGAALGRFARISVGHGFGETADGPISLTQGFLTNGVSTLISGTPITQGTNLTAGHQYMVLNGPVTYNGTVYSYGDIFLVVTGTLGFTGTSTTVVDLTATGTIVAATKYYVLAGPITSNGVVWATGQTFVATATSFTGGFVTALTSTDVSKLYQADYIAYGDKQYMFYSPYYQLSGLYWNDGATCDLITKPLSTQEFNRVGNKMVSALLNFLSLLKGMNVPIDVKTGLVSLAFTSAKQADFDRDYVNPLVITNDISGGSLLLTGTPNGVNTVNWTYTLTINGEPITGSATGTVTFSNT